MENIRIYCENLDEYLNCPYGTTLLELLESTDVKTAFEPLAAIVDNQLKELSFKLVMPHKIKFIDVTDLDGIRTYLRSLKFLLVKAVNTVFPDCRLMIDYTLPNGPYAELADKKTGEYREISEPDFQKVRSIMDDYVRQNLPFLKYKVSSFDAESIFRNNGMEEKAKMVALRGLFFTSVYSFDGYVDTFYGPLVPSSGYLKVFDLVKYRKGLYLSMPDRNMQIPPQQKQDKLYDVFCEDAKWNSIIGVNGIGTVNECILNGNAGNMIMVAEALHERKYADIADMIYSRRNRIKLVLIAGPSSSGKTTTSKRIALQCKVLGLNPKVIEMDNYFVNRELTPKDADGNYDFEHLEAMDLAFLNSQLSSLIAGEEVELPVYDFVDGRRYFNGNRMKLENGDILIMEGIHALNPRLTSAVADENKFKIYASALTSLSIDENNTISTSDNRLLRRIVRDNNFRGTDAEETILRWPSVRRGEVNNIFPYQENADIMFNSSLIFELPLLKYYAEPLLRRITPHSPAFPEAVRLLKFMNFFPALKPQEIDHIPPTSVMREFIGGSVLSGVL